MSVYNAYSNPNTITIDMLNDGIPTGKYQEFELDGVTFVRLHSNPADDDINSNIYPKTLVGMGMTVSYGSSQNYDMLLEQWWTSGYFGRNDVTDIKGRTIDYYSGATGGGTGGGLSPKPKSAIFSKIPQDDISNELIELYTAGMWGNNTGSLYTFYTSSEQTENKKRYYYEVKPTLNSSSSFYVAFGHHNGLGSNSDGGQINDSPSRVIYSQYRLLCLDGSQTKFTISGSETDYIYVINMSRDLYKDKLDPGNWQLSLAELSGSSDLNINFGSNVSVATGSTVYTLIDNSLDSDQTISDEYLDLDIYSVVSGTIANGVYSTEEWGKVYPKIGIIVLDGRVLDSKLNFGTSTGSNIDGDNAYKLFLSISGSGTPTSDRSELFSFDARSSETMTKQHYFIHINSDQFNFSNNPTYVSGTNGELLHETFLGNPITYITSIGLYDNQQELLAIGKFSSPVKKSFTEELHVTLNLEY